MSSWDARTERRRGGRSRAPVARLALTALLAATSSVGCRSEAGSALTVTPGAAGAGGAAAVGVQATWTYRSGSVSVDAALVTTHEADGCRTTGRLLVDKFAARADRYTLEETPCAELEVTDAGDIVLFGSATGHDWTAEELDVDTSREVLSLGPWAPSAEGPTTVTFELSAPSCGGGCECARFIRRWGSQQVMLELGQRCE